MGDDSSPDLSLKLRRGSSDSRDSFYMDFDRGIDSDIDEMATTSGAEHGDTTATPTALGQGKAEGARYCFFIIIRRQINRNLRTVLH